MKTFLALILTAACGGAAAAQESDDFSFARRLAYRGWFDLASDVCARIEKDHSIPRDVRSALPILLAEIELAKADREQDPDKALRFISEAIVRLQKFIAEEESHPRIFEARINIGYLKARKAKIFVDQLEKANAEAHDRLRKEAAQLYQEITGDFETSAADWRRLPTSQEVDGAIMDARLEANRARVEHARIPGLPDVDRKKLLEDAVKSLVDFEIDYGDTAKAFEAMLLEGQALVELAEYAQAETKFKSTIVLRDILEKQRIQRNSYFDQIIFGTYRAMAQLYLKTNRAKDAKLFIESVFASDPSAERQWIGPILKVEKVDALFRLNQAAQAEAEAQRVIEADPNGLPAQLMRNKLAQLSGKGGFVRLAPPQALKAAEGLLERGRMREAMSMLRQTMEGCTTDQDRSTYVPQALFLMGQCLQDMRRPYEAAIVYEKVATQYPKHQVAVKACWEAVVCYSNEFDTFEDPADEKEKDRLMDLLLKQWPGAKETDNIHYLKALKLENSRKLKEAAESYLQVPERASAYERALVRGGYCLRVDAARKYTGIKPSDTAGKQAVIEQMNRAEGIFKKFLSRVETIPSEGPEMARDRASLVIVANQELAYLYNHEAIGKAAEALAFLEKVAKDIPSDDDRMARIHLLQIQSQLVLQKNDEAVKTLELMYDRFEHTRETAQACKSVAIRLDEITSAELKKLAPGAPLPDAAKENLKKISRYYGKWLQGAMAYTMNVTVSDVMSVAETLYLTARRLNGLPDAAFSFMDLKKGMIVGWKNYFEDAEFVHGLLIDKFRTKLVEKDRLTFMMRRARCLSFIADNADGWMRAKQAYEDISKEFKVVNEKGVFNSGALIAQPLLVGTYLEQGAVYYELGRWNKIHFDNAIKVFSDITSVANPGGEPWWISRYMTLLAHFKRGKDKDIMTAQIGIKMLQDNYPDFDGGKYGLKEKFLELKREIDGR